MGHTIDDYDCDDQSHDSYGINRDGSHGSITLKLYALACLLFNRMLIFLIIEKMDNFFQYLPETFLFQFPK